MACEKKTRLPRTTAPGAARLALTGIMAAPDAHGRQRILLVDRAPDGRHDTSWAALARAVPSGPQDAKAGRSAPYALHRPDASPDADGVRGVFWVVLPARHREHWAREAAALRGRAVRAEVTLRPFADGRGASGVSLDLAMLEPWVAA